MKVAVCSRVALLPIVLALVSAQSKAAEAANIAADQAVPAHGDTGGGQVAPGGGQLAPSGSTVSPPAPAEQGIPDIVVVARRTAERLQDVPISIVAIGADQLRSAVITRSSDLIKLVPSLSIGESTTGSANSFSIRGIRTGVVTYFADVPTDTGGVNDQLWDLNSVQALAGPQGTLFGRNSTGGAVLFVPQRPTQDFGGFAEASYGNFDAKRLTAVVNVPVSSSLSVRFGTQIIRRDGVIENQLGPDLQAQHREAYRASVLFQPGNGDFSDYAVFDYAHRNERPNAFITSGPSSPTLGCFGALGCFYGPNSRFGGPSIGDLITKQNGLGIRTVASSFDDVLRSKSYGVSNTAQYQMFGGDLTARYIFGYRHFEQYSIANQSHLDIPLEYILNSNDGTPTYSHEVQLLGKAFDHRLNAVIGAFFSNTNGGFNQNSTDLYGNPSLPFSNDRNIYNRGYTNNDTRGIYAQGTLRVLEGLNLTAGVRFNRVKRFASTQSTGPQYTFFGPQVCKFRTDLVGLDPATCTYVQRATDKATTYNFSADYHVTQSVLLYATTRRGFNAGGFNTTGVPQTNDPTAPQPSFGPEKLTDYEGGIKADFHIGSIPVRTDLAAYLGKYQGIQRLTRGVDLNGTPFQGTANGGKATIYGAQFESTFRLFPRFSVSANYGYLHTRYDTGTAVFAKGNAFAQAPKHTLNVTGDFTQPVSLGGELEASAGLTYQSKIAFNDTNIGKPNAFQDGYSLVDARLAWNKVAGSNIDVSVFAKNLTNKTYAVDLQDQTSLFGYTTLYADPRTYGVQVRVSFGQ